MGTLALTIAVRSLRRSVDRIRSVAAIAARLAGLPTPRYLGVPPAAMTSRVIWSIDSAACRDMRSLAIWTISIGDLTLAMSVIDTRSPYCAVETVTVPIDSALLAGLEPSVRVVVLIARSGTLTKVSVSKPGLNVPCWAIPGSANTSEARRFLRTSRCTRKVMAALSALAVV